MRDQVMYRKVESEKSSRQNCTNVSSTKEILTTSTEYGTQDADDQTYEKGLNSNKHPQKNVRRHEDRKEIEPH